MTFKLRPLARSEWALFRELRLLALKNEPGVFAASYDMEAQKSAAEWQDTIQGLDHQVFGLFAEERLVGITGCFTSRNDPSGETALLAMSFILPEYRGRGLSRLLYEGRLEWIRAQPQFKRVVVSHRRSNDVSRRANQRYGFTTVGCALRTWPDGITEEELFYELNIPKN
jgi:GNAT superfamily N-acetyltransferase